MSSPYVPRLISHKKHDKTQEIKIANARPATDFFRTLCAFSCFLWLYKLEPSCDQKEFSYCPAPFFKNATRSANSCGLNCLSSPAGIIETVLGCIWSTSSWAIRTSWLGPVATTYSFDVSSRITPLIALPS